MPKQSAGILLYKKDASAIKVLLVHPGSPLWTKKNYGAWSIPKGEFEPPEEPLVAAKREFLEETGIAIDGDFIALSPVKLKSGKIVHAFAMETDLDLSAFKSNYFSMEWPPKSGTKAVFQEVDKAEWLDIEVAYELINPGQIPVLREIQRIINDN